MKKTIFRLIYGAVVFCLAVAGIELIMIQKNPSVAAGIREATLPLVTMKTEGTEVNELHGFTGTEHIDAFRPVITPLERDRGVGVSIDLYGNRLTALSFEVRSTDGSRLLKKEEITDYREEEGHIDLHLQVTDLVEADLEYMMILKLSDEDGKEIDYYTRILYPGTDPVADRIHFVQDFHRNSFSKDAASAISTYIEANEQEGSLSLASVDIHSSFDMVTWGNLHPEEVEAPVLNIRDIQKETASFSMEYFVRGGEEQQLYKCTDYYLVRQGRERVYLLDYKRKMEACFDMWGNSYRDGLIDLGIREKNLSLQSSPSGKTVAFLNGGRLYSYSAEDNSVACVYGMDSPEEADHRHLFREHGIRILQTEDNGNLVFLSYGYMNRGIHEGEIGISLYIYNREHRTIEELVFIPENISFELLAQQVEKGTYWNREGTLFLRLQEVLYSIDPAYLKAEIIRDGLSDDSCSVSDTGRLMAWRDGKEIVLLDLSDMEEHRIPAGEGENLIPIGFFGEDLIYGTAPGEETTDSLGNRICPMTKLLIVDEELNVLNEYQKSGIYILSCDIQKGQAVLHRATRSDADGNGRYEYVPAADDLIVNTAGAEGDAGLIQSEKSASGQMVLTLRAKGLKPGSLKYIQPREVQYENDREIRLEAGRLPSFYAYNIYGLLGGWQEADRALESAWSAKGNVIDENGRYIWIYGNRPLKEQIMRIRGIDSEGRNSFEKCLNQILRYEGSSADASALAAQGRDGEDILRESLPGFRVMEMSGCDLETALYYVAQEKPVLALVSSMEEAVLITGYNEKEIVIADPASGELKFISREEMKAKFAAGGSRYLCYTDQR